MAPPARPQQLVLLLLLAAAAASGAQGASAPLPAGLALAPPTPLPTSRPSPLLLGDIRLPPGFSISLYINESDVIKGFGEANDTKPGARLGAVSIMLLPAAAACRCPLPPGMFCNTCPARPLPSAAVHPCPHVGAGPG